MNILWIPLSVYVCVGEQHLGPRYQRNVILQIHMTLHRKDTLRKISTHRDFKISYTWENNLCWSLNINLRLPSKLVRVDLCTRKPSLRDERPQWDLVVSLSAPLSGQWHFGSRPLLCGKHEGVRYLQPNALARATQGSMEVRTFEMDHSYIEWSFWLIQHCLRAK